MEMYGSDTGENRVAALEKQVDGVGVLVGAFTKDLLDLKCHYREMSRPTGEHPPQQPGPARAPCTADTKPAPEEDATLSGENGARAEEPAPDEPDMVMIMQTDGTMKPEVRRGNQTCFSAPVGYGVSGGSDKPRKGIRIMPGQRRIT